MLQVTNARAKELKQDPTTKDYTMIALVVDADGKPTEDTIVIRVSEDGFQKLIRQALPTEEQRTQELLDKIHEIRTTRILSVEEIDKEVEDTIEQSKKDFDACQNRNDIMKTNAFFRIKLQALAQKRMLAKFSMQEESEASYRLTKLRQSKS